MPVFRPEPAAPLETRRTAVLWCNLGSPDEPTINLQSWANSSPFDFVATASTELGKTSKTAAYGPPYSTTQDATQTLGPIDLQSLSGRRIPINTATDFVTTPLRKLHSEIPALATWDAANGARW